LLALERCVCIFECVSRKNFLRGFAAVDENFLHRARREERAFKRVRVENELRSACKCRDACLCDVDVDVELASEIVVACRHGHFARKSVGGVSLVPRHVDSDALVCDLNFCRARQSAVELVGCERVSESACEVARESCRLVNKREVVVDCEGEILSPAAVFNAEVRAERHDVRLSCECALLDLFGCRHSRAFPLYRHAVECLAVCHDRCGGCKLECVKHVITRCLVVERHLDVVKEAFQINLCNVVFRLDAQSVVETILARHVLAVFVACDFVSVGRGVIQPRHVGVKRICTFNRSDSCTARKRPSVLDVVDEREFVAVLATDDTYRGAVRIVLDRERCVLERCARHVVVRNIDVDLDVVAADICPDSLHIDATDVCARYLRRPALYVRNVRSAEFTVGESHEFARRHVFLVQALRIFRTVRVITFAAICALCQVDEHCGAVDCVAPIAHREVVVAVLCEGDGVDAVCHAVCVNVGLCVHAAGVIILVCKFVCDCKAIFSAHCVDVADAFVIEEVDGRDALLFHGETERNGLHLINRVALFVVSVEHETEFVAVVVKHVCADLCVNRAAFIDVLFRFKSRARRIGVILDARPVGVHYVSRATAEGDFVTLVFFALEPVRIERVFVRYVYGERGRSHCGNRDRNVNFLHTAEFRADVEFCVKRIIVAMFVSFKRNVVFAYLVDAVVVGVEICVADLDERCFDLKVAAFTRSESLFDFVAGDVFDFDLKSRAERVCRYRL